MIITMVAKKKKMTHSVYVVRKKIYNGRSDRAIFGKERRMGTRCLVACINKTSCVEVSHFLRSRHGLCQEEWWSDHK